MLATSRYPRSSRTVVTIPVVFVFDDDNSATPIADVMATLPAGSGVVLRSKTRHGETWRETAEQLKSAGFIVLVSAGRPQDALPGTGVHIPEACLANWRQWHFRALQTPIVSASAHSLQACRRAATTGVDLAFASPVFATRSHPMAQPLGLWRLGTWCKLSMIPLAALGGMSFRRADRALSMGARAVAGISMFAK